MLQNSPKVRTHGASGYRCGCRCDTCREAKAAEVKAYYEKQDPERLSQLRRRKYERSRIARFERFRLHLDAAQAAFDAAEADLSDYDFRQYKEILAMRLERPAGQEEAKESTI